MALNQAEWAGARRSDSTTALNLAKNGIVMLGGLHGQGYAPNSTLLWSLSMPLPPLFHCIHQTELDGLGSKKMHPLRIFLLTQLALQIENRETKGHSRLPLVCRRQSLIHFYACNVLVSLRAHQNGGIRKGSAKRSFKAVNLLLWVTCRIGWKIIFGGVFANWVCELGHIPKIHSCLAIFSPIIEAQKLLQSRDHLLVHTHTPLVTPTDNKKCLVL